MLQHLRVAQVLFIASRTKAADNEYKPFTSYKVLTRLHLGTFADYSYSNLKSSLRSVETMMLDAR